MQRKGVGAMGIDINQKGEKILKRIEVMANAHAMELDYYVEGRLQLLKEDTDISLRQLETVTPILNKAKRAMRIRGRATIIPADLHNNLEPIIAFT